MTRPEIHPLPLTRRGFLGSLVGGAAAMAAGACWPKPALAAAAMPDTSKMNILFIDWEDTNPMTFGCYGNTICKTPNLDRLASTGIAFRRAYCQAPCCNPTRTSFLTGLRPPSTHVYSNGDAMNEHLPPGTKSLPQMAKQAGFATADIGKLFHLMEWSEEHMRAFDRIELYDRPKEWNGPGPILKFAPLPQSVREEKAPLRGSKEWGAWHRKQSDRYGDSRLSEEQEGDNRMARTAAALLKEFARTKQRFFMTVGSHRPHTPLICPKKYLDMYDPAKIPPPPAPPEKDQGVPDIARRFGTPRDIFNGGPPTPLQAREAIAAYYACVTFMDAQLGLILEALEKEGLADRTIVVFLGDHGFHLGEHGLWSKYSLFEQPLHAPLIVRAPGAPGNGKPCDELVEFVDIVPTLGELATLPLPGNLEGTSFAPLLVDPARPWKKATFGWTHEASKGVKYEGRSVGAKDARYTEWDYKGQKIVELYDLAKDPWQTVNVADDPAYAAKRKELADLMAAGWKAALPPKG